MSDVHHQNRRFEEDIIAEYMGYDQCDEARDLAAGLVAALRREGYHLITTEWRDQYMTMLGQLAYRQK